VFTIFIDPVAKPRMTQADRWKKRPCVLRYRAFADELRAEAARKNFQLGDAPYVEFHIPMPKSWSKKKKDLFEGTKHKQRPDVDNLLKALFDCLRDEDCGISDVTAKKRWARKGRIVIANQALAD